VVGWLNIWYDGEVLYVFVVRRRVVDVPREMIQSIGESGREAMVAGLSPVKATIIQSVRSVRSQGVEYFWESCIWQ